MTLLIAALWLGLIYVLLRRSKRTYDGDQARD